VSIGVRRKAFFADAMRCLQLRRLDWTWRNGQRFRITNALAHGVSAALSEIPRRIRYLARRQRHPYDDAVPRWQLTRIYGFDELGEAWTRFAWREKVRLHLPTTEWFLLFVALLETIAHAFREIWTWTTARSQLYPRLLVESLRRLG